MNALKELAINCGAVEPRWAHPDAAVQYSGLGRTFLYALIRAGEISSVRIARNNNPRGRAHRLIDLRSIDQWIERHAENGRAQ
jgi:helix-turn-helix protein